MNTKQITYVLSLVTLIGIFYGATRIIAGFETTQASLKNNDSMMKQEVDTMSRSLQQKIINLQDEIKSSKNQYEFLDRSILQLREGVSKNTQYYLEIKSNSSNYVTQNEFNGFKQDFGRSMTVLHTDHQDTNKELFNQQRQIIKCCRRK